MNTLIKVNFGEPVRIDPNSDFLAEEATVLEISDSQTKSELSVILLFQEYPAIQKSLVLYSGEEHTALGDWTYIQLVDRIKLYYEEFLGFPEIGVEVDELPLPEPEASEPPAEEPPAEEPVVTPTKKRSKG